MTSYTLKKRFSVFVVALTTAGLMLTHTTTPLQATTLSSSNAVPVSTGSAGKWFTVSEAAAWASGGGFAGAVAGPGGFLAGAVGGFIASALSQATSHFGGVRLP